MKKVNNPLDNPIWHGLQTGNKKLRQGTGGACFFPSLISASAGLKENDAVHLEHLYEQLAVGRTTTLFSNQAIHIPDKWEIRDDRMLYQMVHENSPRPSASFADIVSLDDRHIPAMIALAEQAKPGAFFERTLDFGNYKGIFVNGKLVSMVGCRFQPEPYVEISAVCTHPDHLGKGLASLIISNLIGNITQQSRMPFLHVSVKNTNAIRLYENLGFKVRRELRLYTILKIN